ncbi:hypothetical protein BDP27DRAFT_1429474 [Rhodocollybia butyracea]|uniref:Uncharacterized protein n=1 Tax=Rhodocollybia butyracea TaxID=206335 RepID=A0A9P5TZK9_9AGAR|nr:hypothetical protein BDP27DRAFT_1429474 [Rhodocollybia butyracea]
MDSSDFSNTHDLSSLYSLEPSQIDPAQYPVILEALRRNYKRLLKYTHTKAAWNNSDLTVIGIWPNPRKGKKPRHLPLLDSVPFGFARAGSPEWIYHSIRCLLGVVATPKVGSPAVELDEDLVPVSDRDHVVLFMHMGGSVPYPKPNTWNASAHSERLSDITKASMKGSCQFHCQLSGSYAFDRENGNESTQVVPAATATSVFKEFVKIVYQLDPSFPADLTLDDCGNILYTIVTIHHAIEGGAVGIYVPDIVRPSSSRPGYWNLTASTVEVHVRPMTACESPHNSPLRELISEVHHSRVVKDEEEGAGHSCHDDEESRFRHWFTKKKPWTSTDSIYPHPILLQPYYGALLHETSRNCDGGKARVRNAV